MMTAEEVVKLICCSPQMAYSTSHNLPATSIREAPSGVQLRASFGSGDAATTLAGFTLTEHDSTSTEAPNVYAHSMNGNDALQQVTPPYTVTASLETVSPTFVVTRKLTALELEWLISRLDVESPVLCENQLVSSTRLAQYDTCCEGSQESFAFQEPEETSRTSKSSISLASGTRELQGTGRTSHSSSSTIDSDVHTLEAPADPVSLNAAHGAPLSNTALAGHPTTLLPKASQPLGASAARAMPSLLQVSEFPVEGLRGGTSSFLASEKRYQADTQNASAPWCNEGLYANVKVQQTTIPDATANCQVRGDFIDSVRGGDEDVRSHESHPHSPVQHNQPACGIQGVWLPDHPLSDDDDMAFRAPEMVLEGDAADKKLPTRAYTESVVRAYGKESYNEDGPLRPSHHGIYAQTSVHKCEADDPPIRMWPAAFDSYYTPSGILRLPLNPRVVTLPVVVELRYLRFDAQMSESYLEIPLINFFIAR